MDNERTEKLVWWQGKVQNAKTRMKNQRADMDERDMWYLGSEEMKPVTEDEAERNGKLKPRHVFNIIAENIDSEIDVNIPQPKVTAVRKRDEPLAKMIEDYLRSELERLRMEEMNDQQERIVPVQGGSYWIVGWDNEQRTHTTVGEVYVEPRHPKQIIPQPGVYTGIEDMDYIAMEIPRTKEDIRRRYGVDLSDENESQADVRSSDGEDSAETELVTQTIVYYRNAEGGIGRYSYVNDHELEDIEDYGARQRRRCSKCGAAEGSWPTAGAVAAVTGEEIPEEAGLPGLMSQLISGADAGPRTAEPVRHRRGECPFCGGRKWETDTDEFRTLDRDYVVTVGSEERILPAYEDEVDELGIVIGSHPVRYPYYRVDQYPIVLQKNISVFGELLGESDVDKIKDQQNTMNQINKVIVDRLFRAGTKISLPRDVEITREPENGEVIRLDDPSQAGQIGTFDFTGNLEYQMAFRAALYEEPRRVLGITNSFQGREDPTATSGVAKEFSAQQSAGRLESKRRMKNAAYERLFELIFKTALANADEPRPMKWRENGQTVYGLFDPMAFYDQDDAGEWYVNDRFLFSTDSAAALPANRNAMWREITSQFQAGTYGDPMQDDTRLLYWRTMEELHYPLAAAAVTAIQERIEQTRQAMAEQQQMMAQQQAMQAPQQAPVQGIPIEQVLAQGGEGAIPEGG